MLHLGFYSMHLSFLLCEMDYWKVGFTVGWMAEMTCCIFQNNLYYRSQLLFFLNIFIGV